MFIKIGDRRININNITYYEPYFNNRIRIYFKENVNGDGHKVIICGNKDDQEVLLKRLDNLTEVQSLDHYPGKIEL